VRLDRAPLKIGKTTRSRFLRCSSYQCTSPLLGAGLEPLYQFLEVPISRSGSPFKVRLHQRGQALIYGLFVLLGGLSALFFLFNTGQLSREKTKLVNATDAVAYSAGVMHARALNYAAYTNRAMIANEVSIAQMVSLSSWIQYVETHADSTAMLGCETQYSEPVAKAMTLYIPVCYFLFYANAYGTVEAASQAIQAATEAGMVAADLAKQSLQLSQDAMVALMPLARNEVMNQVARANYTDDGAVEVDLIPLLDTFYAFEGAPVIAHYTKNGDERKRFAEATRTAANSDRFIPSRRWRADAKTPSCLDPLPSFDYVNRVGGTELIGYDQWRALDTASIYRYTLRTPKFGLPYCDDDENALGYGDQNASNGSSSNDTPSGAVGNPSASGMASSSDWNYSGIPSFYELSEKALGYTPDNTDPDKRDPKIRFAVRVTRHPDQTRTSDAASQIKGTPRLNAYKGQPAGDVYASVSASEVFFLRPEMRADGNLELASLFNPYWQIHLIDAPQQIKAAQVLQGVVLP
jgi:hypothetical protein